MQYQPYCKQEQIRMKTEKPIKKIIKAGLFALLLTASANYSQAQEASDKEPSYSLLNAHSHNDYENDIPFQRAFQKGFGSIEADIFPINNELLVAHSKEHVNPSVTLYSTYIKPAIAALQKDPKRKLHLLIDIKENYPSALAILIKQLEPHKDLLKTSTHPGQLTITISGSRPKPNDYKNYPDYIYFDGEWPLQHTPEESKHVELVSFPFTAYSKWNGKGRLEHADYTIVKGLIDSVHAEGKKIRFWATPDTKSSWLALMNLHVDLIGTDAVESLGNFIKDLAKNIYINKEIHKTYQPTYQSDGKNGKIKNVILLIGDGMGLTQIYSAFTANQGQLNLFKMRNIGVSVTNAADTYITDSAAGGTAMAGGQKTNNRAIGVDSTEKPLKSLAVYAAEEGKKTAVISVGDLADATPAAFYAHQPDRSMEPQIAQDMHASGINMFLGSGISNFKKTLNGTTAVELLEKKGYTVTYTFEDFKKSNADKLVGLVPDNETRPKIEGRGEFLTEAFLKATQQLAKDPKGLFMMLEGAQIDYGGHRNNVSQVITENLDFDKVIGKALEFADSNGETLIVVTADHETGGLTLLDGDIQSGYVLGEFSTNDHTAVPVPVFAYGPHSDDFRGVYANTEIFKRLLKYIKK